MERHRKMKRFALALGVVVLSTATFTACSSSSTTSKDSTPTSSSDASTSFNDDDVMFAQMMIPHHEQAIELSDIALDPSIGASSSIIQLAQQIKGAQDPEITLMKNLLAAWGKPSAMDDSMDHSSMMTGMLTLDELEQIENLQGASFDKSWAQAMIKHHEGAVTMAQDVLAKGSHTQIRNLAQEIIASQTAEIQALQKLIQ